MLKRATLSGVVVLFLMASVAVGRPIIINVGSHNLDFIGEWKANLRLAGQTDPVELPITRSPSTLDSRAYAAGGGTMSFWKDLRTRHRSLPSRSRHVPQDRLSHRSPRFEVLETRSLLSISITGAWLAQQGPAPYLLTSSNETYVLDTDVTVNGTAFVVGGANITLDLNGHTVTYGNAGSPTVTNGGFETGNIGDNYLTPVLGWDLTGCTVLQLPRTRLFTARQSCWVRSVWALSTFRLRKQSSQMQSRSPKRTTPIRPSFCHM